MAKPNPLAKADPVACGDHRYFWAPMAVAPAEPWTISMAASRTLPAVVFANAVLAGIMASSRGRAMVTPMPRSMVRREMCFRVIYIRYSSSWLTAKPDP